MVETIYRCSDGKEFTDSEMADLHEWCCEHVQTLKYITIKDYEGNVILDDINLEDTYLKTESICILNQEALDLLKKVAIEKNWDDYINMQHPGYYEFVTGENGVQHLEKIYAIYKAA